MHYATLENCPLVLIEAARAGVPVAAIPAGGVPELQAALDCKFDLIPHDLRGTLENVRGRCWRTTRCDGQRGARAEPRLNERLRRSR